MSGTTHDAERDALDPLVEEYLDRTAHGEEAQAVAQALCGAHPALAERLKLRLDLLRRAGLLAAPGEASLPEALGEFRILRRLGGGGMGVVYLAEQPRLGRVVALKVIHPAQLHFRGARERFLREVQSVARLQHPGIVPVYAVGEQDGVPYFAMERVPGCTLEEALEDVRATARETGAPRAGSALASAVAHRGPAEQGPPDDGSADSYVFAGTWEQACLRIARQVADALHHAHQRGIVHRDVKPSNVALTREGRAMLLDFGLAGRDDAATLTAAGSPLGSLPYMSPEQARGERERIDARSDVYSLGVTLYELLTLRRAFDDPSAARVVADIEQGRRASPRQLNPQLSWETETVCLTAMDPDPARRYATAGDFARDLLNVLDHRPIEARRAGPWLRARRWAQRRPAAAVALVAGLLLVVGGPSALAIQQHRHNLRLQAQQDATMASLRQAIGALDGLTNLGGDALQYVPQLEPLRARLLDEAIALSGKLTALAADDPRVLAEALDLQVQIGDLHLQQGQMEAALASGLAAQELARRLGDVGRAERRAAAHSITAKSLKELGRYPEAAAEFEEAIRLMESEPVPTEDELLERAQYWFELSTVHMRVTPAEAEPACRAGLALLEGLTQPKAAMWAAIGSDRLGNALQMLSRRDEALACSRAAVAGLEAVCAGDPSWIEPRTHLAVALNNQALALAAPDQREEAMAALRRSIEISAELAADFPANTMFTFSLARSSSVLGNRLAEGGKIEEALAEHARARELLEGLTRAHPESINYALELATICVNDSLIHWGLPAPDVPAIRVLSDEAVARSEALVALEPGAAKHQSLLSTALVSRANVQRAEDDLPGARQSLEAAIEHGGRALELQPERRSFRTTLLDLYSELGGVLDAQGDRAALSAAADRLRATLPDDPKACVRAARLLTLAGDARLLECLRAALERGVPAAELQADPAFAAVRDGAEFQALLAEGR